VIRAATSCHKNGSSRKNGSSLSQELSRQDFSLQVSRCRFPAAASRCSVPLTRARDSNPDVILQSTPPARWTTRSAKAVGLESNQQQPAKRQQELCQQHNGFSISCDFNYKVARRSPAHIFGRVGVSRQTDQLCLPIPTALELEWPAFCSALSATYNPLGESTKAAA
jgi:hypothetical protein